MEYNILVALGSIKKKDSSAFRALLFCEYRKKYRLAQLSSLTYAISIFRPFVVFFLIIYSFRKVISVSFLQKKNSNELYVYNYENEKKSILHNFSKAKNANELTYSYSFRNLFRSLKSLFFARLDWARLLKIIKLCFHLSKKNSFLVTARQIEFLLLYAFFKNFFKKENFKEVYISTESNPEVISVALACVGARVNYTNHGFLNKDLGIFFHDRLLLDCRSLKNRIIPHLLRPHTDIQIIQKRHQIFKKPESSTKKILILGSLIPDIGLMQKLIEDFRENLVDSDITVRFHPNKTFYNHQLLELSELLKIKVKWDESLKLQLSESTLVIAGETSAHLEALMQGVPSVYCKLDHFPRDHYGFISSQLIPEMKSVGDLEKSVQKFYSDPKWLKVYQDYFGE